MLTGRVNASFEPVVDIKVVAADGAEVAISVLVDTGFNGYLALSAATIRTLGLRYRGRRTGTLANGSKATFSVYRAAVQWHGRQRPVIVHEADGQAFIGMKLIAGSRLEVFATADGNVIIDELP
jgi:predicted aspartyl protease